jgi:oxaloacetate decarboxylase alpha subunit
MAKKNPLGITDVVLRDAHQSILATRMRLDDMLPIAGKLDQVGFWSVESWGGATFDACIRYLGEDPWDRIRQLKAAMPNTPQQMLLRGQNILGYRNYADDVVQRFVERSVANGVDVFRVFDAMNDPRNLQTAIKAVIASGKHAQGAISYTVSPVHTVDLWVSLSKQIEDMGAHSLCIKDMAGLLKPYVAFELVSRLKKALSIPIHMQCHATTGMSTAAIVKAAEAGIDNVDTAISSMSMTYGHSPTEAVVAIFEDTDRDTGLDLELLEEIAGYFREVRKKYAKFEGGLKGIDSRILVAQVPGGMLTNLESQLREQNAINRLDEVLAEIPKVREDLGQIPLVTPTSQIVGTQAVLNVVAGARYKAIPKETAAVLKGEYGATAAPVNKELQKRVLEGGEPITCRPADLLKPEMARLETELKEKAKAGGFTLASNVVDDVLTYALFAQTALKFLENRGNAAAFEPAPTAEPEKPKAAPAAAGGIPTGTFNVTIDGKGYTLSLAEGGAAAAPAPVAAGAPAPAAAPARPAAKGEPVPAPLGGNVFKVLVKVGDTVEEGDPMIVLEAMKMEMEVYAPKDGTVTDIAVAVGQAVTTGQTLALLD